MVFPITDIHVYKFRSKRRQLVACNILHGCFTKLLHEHVECNKVAPCMLGFRRERECTQWARARYIYNGQHNRQRRWLAYQWETAAKVCRLNGSTLTAGIILHKALPCGCIKLHWKTLIYTLQKYRSISLSLSDLVVGGRV